MTKRGDGIMDGRTVTIIFKDHNMQPLKIKIGENDVVAIKKWDNMPYMAVNLESSVSEGYDPLYLIAEDAIAYVDWGNNDAEI